MVTSMLCSSHATMPYDVLGPGPPGFGSAMHWPHTIGNTPRKLLQPVPLKKAKRAHLAFSAGQPTMAEPTNELACVDFWHVLLGYVVCAGQLLPQPPHGVCCTVAALALEIGRLNLPHANVCPNWHWPTGAA